MKNEYIGPFDKSEKMMLNSSFKEIHDIPQEKKHAKQQIKCLQKTLKDQQDRFLNQTARQDLLMQKLLAKISLQQNQIQLICCLKEVKQKFKSFLDFCSEHINLLMESNETFKKDWSQVIKSVCKQNSVNKPPKHQQCKCMANSNQNQSCECVKLSEQNNAKLSLIEYLEIEVEQLSLKSKQILKENEKMKEQCLILSSLNSENIKKICQYEQENHFLHEKNREMTHQLKQTKDRAKKQSEQWTMKLQAIQRENKRLGEFKKYAVQNEYQLNKIIGDNQQEIQKISEEICSLKSIVHRFQMRFQQLTENEVKIKNMDDLKLRKLEGKYVLSEIPTQNTLDSAQSRIFKESLEKMRRFKLQEFQQKLSSLQTINNDLKQTIKN